MTSGLGVGVKVRELATRDAVYTQCTMLHSDSIGVVFEVHRTVSEGGTVEDVVSQIMVPWSNVKHILLLEERT